MTKTRKDPIHQYGFDSLRKHTRTVRRDGSNFIDRHIYGLRETFAAFDQCFQSLQKEPKSLGRNVRMVFAARFINHAYAALLLAESGLMVEAITAERSAVEALAAYRLLLADPNASEEYHQGSFKKPVKVRERLEELGYKNEAEALKSIYSVQSGFAHMGRDHEKFSLQWESELEGRLQVGGVFKEEGLGQTIKILTVLIGWFVSPLNDSKIQKI